MLLTSEEMENKVVLEVAAMMCVAARTAPKAHGWDTLVTKVVTGEEIEVLAREMKRMGENHTSGIFVRDSGNMAKTMAVVLIGTSLKRMRADSCNYCGFEGCNQSEKAGARCAFDSGDLGIAIGSAVSVAANHKVDNRVMYSAGRAAISLGWLGEEVAMAYAIPLSISGKSPYFDR